MRRFIFLSFLVLLLGIPHAILAAPLFVSPAGGTYSVGDRITLKVLVSSDTSINAVSGTLAFSKSMFSVETLSKASSIINFWASEPTFSNTTGTINFEGVALAGFQGTAGTVFTMTLRALKAGSGTISFQSGQVLANDGQGTDITSGLSGGTFQIEAAKAQSVKTQPIPSPSLPIEQPTPEAPVLPTLTSPVITLGTQNDLPAIFGSSVYPKADVLLTFVPVTGSKLFITGTTNGDGDFFLFVPQALRNGPYAVSAIIVSGDGTQSDFSNILTVEVGGVFAVGVSWESATYVSMILVILLSLFTGYFMWRRYVGPKRTVPSAIKKEVKEAESALHKSFALLKQDDNIADLKKDLKEAEEYIGKEIQDINRIHLDEKE